MGGNCKGGGEHMSGYVGRYQKRRNKQCSDLCEVMQEDTDKTQLTPPPCSGEIRIEVWTCPLVDEGPFWAAFLDRGVSPPDAADVLTEVVESFESADAVSGWLKRLMEDGKE